MLSWSTRAGRTAALIAGATLLGGCVTGTEVSYSAYQYDRYGGTERTYEHSLSADPARGIEIERCRTVASRHINRFGEEVVRRGRVCRPTGEIDAAEPGAPQPPRRNVYSSPIEPPEDVFYLE